MKIFETVNSIRVTSHMVACHWASEIQLFARPEYSPAHDACQHQDNDKIHEMPHHSSAYQAEQDLAQNARDAKGDNGIHGPTLNVVVLRHKFFPCGKQEPDEKAQFLHSFTRNRLCVNREIPGKRRTLVTISGFPRGNLSFPRSAWERAKTPIFVRPMVFYLGFPVFQVYRTHVDQD